MRNLLHFVELLQNANSLFLDQPYLKILNEILKDIEQDRLIYLIQLTSFLYFLGLLGLDALASIRPISHSTSYNLSDNPNAIAGVTLKRPVNTNKIVVHKKQTQHMYMILQLLAESVRLPGKPTHTHTHSKIMTLHV